ncbi:MAG: DUF4296 domain-containing protein [Bacteroidales bacterium]|nr:DUF4296 domain-containing protein [Bacteroidales bacterium]
MRRIAPILLAILTLCTACHKKHVLADKPDNLIKHDKMVEILTESYMAEAFIYAMQDSLPTEELTQSLYKDIFNRHGITKDQFIQSVDYYSSDKELFQKMLDEISENIMRQRNSSNIPDSLFNRSLEDVLQRNRMEDDSTTSDSIQPVPGIDI